MSAGPWDQSSAFVSRAMESDKCSRPIYGSTGLTTGIRDPVQEYGIDRVREYRVEYGSTGSSRGAWPRFVFFVFLDILAYFTCFFINSKFPHVIFIHCPICIYSLFGAVSMIHWKLRRLVRHKGTHPSCRQCLNHHCKQQLQVMAMTLKR